MKKTKIVCTISDRNCDVEFISNLFKQGMNIARINSAHVTPESAQIVVDNIRKVSDNIAILVDTKGPEVRLTAMEPEEGFTLLTGETIEIFNDINGICTKKALFTNCSTFVDNVPLGARVLIDDGETALKVIEKTTKKLVCKAESSTRIKGKKSVNVPNVTIDLPAVSEKDYKFIVWSVEANIDFIAHSFVRNKEDLMAVQKILNENAHLSPTGSAHQKIISKIENQEGIDNLDEILDYSYGIMIARGDLGVEIPAERIPKIQKMIASTCRERKRPVIIATQMLHSMIDNPRPTRAEVTDVANAIMQSTDCVMLSGETANGKFPLAAVNTMATIAKEAEIDVHVKDIELQKVSHPLAEVLSKSLVGATKRLPIKAIIIDTNTGRTARYLSAFRPDVPIYAFCYQEHVKRELAASFGVHAYAAKKTHSKNEFRNIAFPTLIEEGLVQPGDLVGIIGGNYVSEEGANYMEIVTVG